VLAAILVEDDDHVGTAEILLPIHSSIADVDAGKHLPEARRSDDELENNHQMAENVLMFVGDQSREQALDVPDFVMPVAAAVAPFRLEPPNQITIEDHGDHEFSFRESLVKCIQGWFSGVLDTLPRPSTSAHPVSRR